MALFDFPILGFSIIGERGDTGEKGDYGLKGDSGPTGEKGTTGDLGFKGEKGLPGQPGPRVSEIFSDNKNQLEFHILSGMRISMRIIVRIINTILCIFSKSNLFMCTKRNFRQSGLTILSDAHI